MSSCSCGCLADDYDGPEFCEERRVVARKERRCVGCSGMIWKGQRAVVVVGKWGGDFSTYQYHDECVRLVQTAADLAGTGWLYGCDVIDCASDLLDQAVWPRDRELIELVSAVFAHAEDE